MLVLVLVLVLGDDDDGRVWGGTGNGDGGGWGLGRRAGFLCGIGDGGIEGFGGGWGLMGGETLAIERRVSGAGSSWICYIENLQMARGKKISLCFSNSILSRRLSVG